MPFDTITSVTDDVTDNLAQYHNEMGTAITHLMRSTPFGNWGSATSSSGTLTLTNTDYPLQAITPGTANVTVVFPAAGTANHPFFLINAGTAAYSLQARASGGGTVGGTIGPGNYQSYLSSGTAGYYAPAGGQASAGTSAGGSNSICDGRLTLESGVPFSTTDQTAKTTVYFTPFVGNKISLYNGSSWDVITFTELSLSLSGYTANKNYDIFVYNNSGTATLESLVWTSDSARATALVRQDGVLCKTGVLTRRYVGTIRITGTTGQCEDSASSRLVWNMYNGISSNMPISESTAHTYASSTWRKWNNSDTNNLAKIVVGQSIMVTCFNAANLNTTANTTPYIDGSQMQTNVQVANNGTANLASSCAANVVVADGYHYFQIYESTNTGTGNYNWMSFSVNHVR